MTHPTPTRPTPYNHPTPTWPTPPLHDPPHPYMTWKIRVQECKGGRAGSHQWCHVTSRDIIAVIRGGGVGGVGHGNLTSSPVTLTVTVISVHHEGDHFKIWNFYCICRKAAAFSGGLSFNIEIAQILVFDLFSNFLDWVASVFPASARPVSARPISARPHVSQPISRAPKPHSPTTLTKLIHIPLYPFVNFPLYPFVNFKTLWVIFFEFVSHKWLNANWDKIDSIIYICHLSFLKKLSPNHTHPLISIHKFLKPYEFYFLSLSHL